VGGRGSAGFSLSSLSALHFYPIILFLSPTLLTGMTGISLHMQWLLNSQLHGGFLNPKKRAIGFSLRIKLHALSQ
jgi:hypothetical protein